VVVCVIVVVELVDTIEVEVDVTEVSMKVVEVETVDTNVEVEVSVVTPPKGPKWSIVDSGSVLSIVGPGGPPTIQPTVGEIM
jgi:hypothetical protein